jgi:predicted Zn-dependent peptidase
MIRKQKLPNGLILLSETMPHVRSVSVGVWLRLGSRNEQAKVNGISHFIEHLVFKGTTSRTAREISLQMDSIGGQIDAFTSKEYTGFYAKVLDDHLPTAIDLLADIVQRPLFDPEEVERERRVVLEEIRMVEDTPDELAYDLLSKLLYPSNALGRPIQGTEESVASLSTRQLRSFFRNAYRPENMLIVAAGNLKHADLARMVRKAFRGLESGHGRSNGHARRPREHSGMVMRSKRELEQLHLLLAVPAFQKEMKFRYPFFVFNALLGGTMSSRLFQRIREERGLVYTVYSALNGFRDSGFLNIYAGTGPSKGREVVDLVMHELRDLRDNGPTQAEVDVAKEHLKGNLMLGLEATSSRMSNLARQEIYFGRQLRLEETLKGIDRVTVKSVHSLAHSILDDESMRIAAVGRVGGLRLKQESLVL